MKRRACGLLPLCLLAGCGADDRVERGAAPTHDVLIFLVDTLRADHLGLYGYERATDPRLARFAEDAVTFERAYAPSSWTKPSTASLLTGVDPLGHGAITGADRIDPQALLLGEVLQQHGYATTAYSANPNVLEVWGFAQGFDRFEDLYATKGLETEVSDFVDALRAQRQADDARQPTFHYLHTIDPHKPYRPPAEHSRWPFDPARVKKPVQLGPDTDESDLAATVNAYDGEIAFSDHFFGELLDELEAEGRYDDTLIVYASDHGEEFLDHGRGGHQRTLYEEVLRVPLLIKFPGQAFAGRRVDQPVSLMDVMPTVLGRLGIELPPELVGRDLWSLLSDPASFGERALFFDLDRESRGDGPNHTAQAVIAGRFKLIRSVSPESRLELYDLERDPSEHEELGAREPALVRHLEELLDARSTRSADGLHLLVTNEDDDRQRRFEGRLRTDGRFVGIAARGLEEGDACAPEEQGRVLRFAFTLTNAPNPGSPPPRFLVDQDGVTFRLDPPQASLELLAFECQGDPDARLLLGAQRAEAGALPRRLSASRDELRASAAVLRAASSTDPRAAARGDALLVEIRAPAEPEIDEELRERLRALGYGDGQEEQ